MFYKLGIKQLLKSKRILGLSILTVALGVGIFFTINVTTDTLQGSMDDHFDLMFGNVDRTVYRSDGLFHLNHNMTIPRNYTSTIKSTSGVISVTSRVGRPMTYYHSNDVDQYGNIIFGLDVENPDEVNIGIGVIIDCLPALGNPNDTTLEEVLNYTGVPYPVVVSQEVSLSKGYNVGDQIRIIPENATRAYATAQELLDLQNNVTTLAELESSIKENASRLVQWTVVGIFLDGSECPEKPVPDKDLSFTGFMPNKETIYIRMNDSFQWVFNQHPDEVAYFLVDINDQFQEGSLENSIFHGNMTVQIISHDTRAAFQAYIDYVVVLVRVLLICLTLTSWISCGMLVKTIVQMNINEKLREIGILQAIGFKKKPISEMVFSQIIFMSAIGTGIGMVIGLIPPQFFDLDVLVQFLSYNKVYGVSVESEIIVTLLSASISIISGLVLPLLFGIIPLRKMNKWSIVELITPTYMQMKQNAKPKILQRRNKVLVKINDLKVRKELIQKWSS